MAQAPVWTIDAVLARMLDADPDTAARLVEAAETQGRDGLHGQFGKEDPWPTHWGRMALEYDRRAGRRHIRVKGLRLARDITYSSAYDQTYARAGWGSDDPGSGIVHHDAAIRATGILPPATVLAALVGRHPRAVLAHRALEHPGHRILWAGLNGREGAWEGFGVTLTSVGTRMPA